ncbi:MAG: isopenicillin N synthase family dioxygenase [Myxococcota bacterium]
MEAEIAVVDVGGLASGDARAVERVAARIEAPSRACGVFHVTGHGIPPASLEAFDAAMRALFALPRDVKQSVRRTRTNAWGYYDQELTKNRPDWKEIFDFGPERSPGAPHHSDGVNQWPAGQDAIRRALLRHHAACEALGRALLSALCVSLGLAPDRLDACFQDGSSFLRLNHYPACPDPAGADAAPLPERGRLGVHPHSDAGALTLLYQDGVAGLQIEHGDGFALVAPVAGALTVNLGDMLRVWSNDRYRSPVHRVLARSDRDRYSAPFFLNPRYDTVCEPLLEGPHRDDAPRFRPVSWARFRDQRSAGDYADQGAEIQVDDFRCGSLVN